MLPAPRSPDGRTIRDDHPILADRDGAASIMPVTIPLERVNSEIKRRTRVVGSFPDGQSALNLAAARLHRIAGTRWSIRRYLDMTPLQKPQLQTA